MIESDPLTIGANLAQIASAIATAVAAFFAWLSARSSSESTAISSADTGFEIVHKLINETKTLWEEYIKLRDAPESENRWKNIDNQLNKILDSAEWSCIYIKSREKHRNYSIDQLEEEVLAPLERILQPQSSAFDYLREKIYSKKDNYHIYKTLVSLLNDRGVAAKFE